MADVCVCVLPHARAHAAGMAALSLVLSAGTDDIPSGACSYQNVINCCLLNSVVIC